VPTSGDDRSNTSRSVTPSPIGQQSKRKKKLTPTNDVIFEGELEALTKDFKVMNSQPHHTFKTNDLLQFNPQLYHPTYIPRIFEHQLPNSQHLSNMTIPNAQHLSNATPPISHTNEPEQANFKQPNIQQPESQQPEIQSLIYSNYMPSSSKTINTDLNQLMENNVSVSFQNSFSKRAFSLVKHIL